MPSRDGREDDAEEGRYRMGARLSYAIVGAYGFMLILIVVVVAPRSHSSYDWVFYFLLALTLLFLVRYLSTRYSMDDTNLVAWRILGGCKVALEEVRAIEYASLRDLAPTGGAFGIGSFGWRGRMHSTSIGEFNSIYTDPAAGLLVTAGAYPLYISPKDRDEFARELSRRVRSYTGPLPKDVGNPAAGSPGPAVSSRSPTGTP
jgi:Bacterial PH domain